MPLILKGKKDGPRNVPSKSKKILPLFLIATLPLLGGCNISTDNLIYGFFSGEDSKALGKETDVPIYNQYEMIEAKKVLLSNESRFKDKLSSYSGTVNRLWENEGFSSYISDKKESPKQQLISFYLFMEYHQDTQLRNLQYPKQISKELLTIEAMFAAKAISQTARKDFGSLNELRDELVTYYRGLYSEELVTILFENKNQVDLSSRVPSLITRFNEDFKSTGLSDKLNYLLDLETELDGRGIGATKNVLYGGSNEISGEDIDLIAHILTIEMRISGLNMKLEKYFYVKNGLTGVPTEIKELKSDIKSLEVPTYLSWVKSRMTRSVNYLQTMYKFYNGDKKMSQENVFVELRTREDFYSLEKLSDTLEKTIEETGSWADVQKYQLKQRINSKLVVDESERVTGKFKGD